MATCKDCINYTECNAVLNKYGMKLDPEREICSIFKDRSRFVELPCKVYTTHLGRVVEAKIYGYEASMKNSNYSWTIEPHHFGKYVFFTHKEAEQALKEHERK